MFNVPAIRFYLGCGFQFHGLDTSLYNDDDLEAQNIAVFMRKSLVRS